MCDVVASSWLFRIVCKHICIWRHLLIIFQTDFTSRHSELEEQATFVSDLTIWRLSSGVFFFQMGNAYFYGGCRQIQFLHQTYLRCLRTHLLVIYFSRGLSYSDSLRSVAFFDHMCYSFAKEKNRVIRRT